MQPLVSIVTPSFNQAHFLEATMRSVLDQEYPRLEYVVQDGGSRDGTPELLRRHEGRLLAWESKPDRGQAHAGRGIDAFSSGAWFHGWDVAARHRRGEAPVVAPTVWLLREGWRCAGAIPPPT